MTYVAGRLDDFCSGFISHVRFNCELSMLQPLSGVDLGEQEAVQMFTLCFPPIINYQNLFTRLWVRGKRSCPKLHSGFSPHY